MLRTIALLLPAVFPSWRFFKTVAPSPRIQYRVVRPDGDGPWIEAFGTPEHVSLTDMVWRLVWNPERNARLYLVTCAEKLAEEDCPHCKTVILNALAEWHPPQGPDDRLQFRLVFVARELGEIARSVDYESLPLPWPGS